MSERLQLVTLASDVDADRWCDEHRATSLLVAPTLPGGFHAGDAIRRTTADERPDATVVALEEVVCETVAEGERRRPNGIYRVALFAADRRPTPERVHEFEADLVGLADQVEAIARWRLARVTQHEGSMPWTHVWEQEYAVLDDLTGPYMLHPAHWGMAERWFDPEFPEWLVHPHLCHAFCEIDGRAW